MREINMQSPRQQLLAHLLTNPDRIYLADGRDKILTRCRLVRYWLTRHRPGQPQLLTVRFLFGTEERLQLTSKALVEMANVLYDDRSVLLRASLISDPVRAVISGNDQGLFEAQTLIPANEAIPHNPGKPEPNYYRGRLVFRVGRLAVYAQSPMRWTARRYGKTFVLHAGWIQLRWN